MALLSCSALSRALQVRPPSMRLFNFSQLTWFRPPTLAIPPLIGSIDLCSFCLKASVWFVMNGNLVVLDPLPSPSVVWLVVRWCFFFFPFVPLLSFPTVFSGVSVLFAFFLCCVALFFEVATWPNLFFFTARSARLFILCTCAEYLWIFRLPRWFDLFMLYGLPGRPVFNRKRLLALTAVLDFISALVLLFTPPVSLRTTYPFLFDPACLLFWFALALSALGCPGFLELCLAWICCFLIFFPPRR